MLCETDRVLDIFNLLTAFTFKQSALKLYEVKTYYG